MGAPKTDTSYRRAGGVAQAARGRSVGRSLGRAAVGVTVGLANPGTRCRGRDEADSAVSTVALLDAKKSPA
jgi:hypothetical protein